ncbi:hypothetical protein HYQ44_004897 [Verticillium longisporum]|nr:hypothetical protein HYQ44_004897 [Verticillium longisporum]
MKVGLAHHFVLHLAMGLAGFHLAYLNSHDHDRQAHYLSAARCHVSSGLAEVARTLPNCDESNCGAVYLASLLVSYCSYAAGPSSPNDLFVCSVGDDTSQPRPALISGTRLLRESYRHDCLFSGLMEPFGPATHFSVDPRPTYLCHGFPRIDWVRPFEELRELIGSLDGPNFSVYNQAVDGLEVVYDATYGRGNDTYDGDKSNKMARDVQRKRDATSYERAPIDELDPSVCVDGHVEYTGQAKPFATAGSAAMARMLDALPLRQHIILTRNSAATHKQLVDNTISQHRQTFGAFMRIRRATQQWDTSHNSREPESSRFRGPHRAASINAHYHAPHRRSQMSDSPASSPMTSSGPSGPKPVLCTSPVELHMVRPGPTSPSLDVQWTLADGLNAAAATRS